MDLLYLSTLYSNELCATKNLVIFYMHDEPLSSPTFQQGLQAYSLKVGASQDQFALQRLATDS